MASSSSSSPSKYLAIFCAILLLSLFFSATCEARPVPSKPMEVGHVDVINDNEAAEKFMVEESCEGVGEEEECLMRRTLAAHTDYIYTQKHKP